MAVSTGLVIALIKALGGADPSAITSAVDAWLEAHPEATTTVEDGSITYAKLATALAALIDGKQASVPATSGDVGKYLKAKTVADGVVTEYAFGSPGGGGGGAVDDVQVNGVSVVTDGVAEITIDPVETVTGATPSISAEPGVRYICGEVSTLTIVVPSSGIIDVTFESGSTPTVLTVTPPTGVTMRWANGFDPTSLDANTVYEINIMDGEFGVVGEWT